MFLEMLFDGLCLLGCVHSGAEFIREDDTDACTIFEGSELLEGLGLLQTARGPGHKLKEETALKAVDAEVPVATRPGLWIPHKGQRTAAKVERVAMGIEDDFDDIRISDLGGVVDGSCGGDHLYAGVITQRSGQLIDQGRRDERLVALYIDEDSVVGKGCGGLGDTVGATGVIGVGEDRFGSEGGCCLGDSDIIGRDDHVVDLLALLAALPDMLNERFSGDEVQRLAWEAGRAPAGRNGDEGA